MSLNYTHQHITLCLAVTTQALAALIMLLAVVTRVSFGKGSLEMLFPHPKAWRTIIIILIAVPDIYNYMYTHVHTRYT